MQAQWGRIVRPNRLQQRAPAFDIARDVVEIDARKNATAAKPVEDNQIEFVQLFFEQLADRKGDQRQLIYRRSILLFRRAQDREMHQIDRRIGFQQIPPGALARMGFAADQQNPQPFAHARHHRGSHIVPR